MKEILVEEVTSHQTKPLCDGEVAQACYDVSTLTHNNCLYYFKRVFGGINNGKSYLQLYKCILDKSFKEEKVVTPSGKQYIFKEDTCGDKLCRFQWNSIFSKQLDEKKDGSSNDTEDVFLDKQYVLFQIYDECRQGECLGASGNSYQVWNMR